MHRMVAQPELAGARGHPLGHGRQAPHPPPAAPAALTPPCTATRSCPKVLPWTGAGHADIHAQGACAGRRKGQEVARSRVSSLTAHVLCLTPKPARSLPGMHTHSLPLSLTRTHVCVHTGTHVCVHMCTCITHMRMHMHVPVHTRMCTRM